MILPLFGLGPSSKGHGANLWLSSNRIALFHWTLDLGPSSKVALKCPLFLILVESPNPMKPMHALHTLNQCVCVCVCVCVCIVQFIVTKGSSLIMFSYSHALKILNHGERKLHLEFGSRKTFNMKRLLCLVQPPPFHQQKLGPEISSLGH